MDIDVAAISSDLQASDSGVETSDYPFETTVKGNGTCYILRYNSAVDIEVLPCR